MMFHELKQDLKLIKDEVQKVKGERHAGFEDINSILSSLDSDPSLDEGPSTVFSPPHNAPLLSPPHNAPVLSPPPAAMFQYRPRANSLPPIFLEPYGDQTSNLLLPAAAAQAQRVRNDQLLPLSSATASYLGQIHQPSSTCTQPVLASATDADGA